MLQKGLEGMGQNLIRAVPNEHLLRRDLVSGRNRRAQKGSVRIGIKAQTARCGGDDRSQDARRRSVRILVCIELDDVVRRWLFTRHVWRQPVDD